MRLAVLALLVTLLVSLAALASRPDPTPPSEAGANAGAVIAIVHLVQIIALAVSLLGLLLLVALFVLARRRRKDEEEEDGPFVEPVRVHWAIRLLISAAPFLTLAALLYSLARSGRTLQLPELPAQIAGVAPAADGGEFARQVNANLGLSAWEVGIALLLVALVVALVLRAFRAPSPESLPWLPTEGDATGRDLASAVDAGLRDARREPDPRRAVIAAYATMERLLAARGLPRGETEAPLEYLTRLSGNRVSNRDALRTLTALFARARFSQHEVSAAAREQAISALALIEQELRTAP